MFIVGRKSETAALSQECNVYWSRVLGLCHCKISMALLTECEALLFLVYKHGTPDGVEPLVPWST